MFLLYWNDKSDTGRLNLASCQEYVFYGSLIGVKFADKEKKLTFDDDATAFKAIGIIDKFIKDGETFLDLKKELEDN